MLPSYRIRIAFESHEVRATDESGIQDVNGALVYFNELLDRQFYFCEGELPDGRRVHVLEEWPQGQQSHLVNSMIEHPIKE